MIFLLAATVNVAWNHDPLALALFGVWFTVDLVSFLIKYTNVQVINNYDVNIDNRMIAALIKAVKND